MTGNLYIAITDVKFTLIVTMSIDLRCNTDFIFVLPIIMNTLVDLI